MWSRWRLVRLAVSVLAVSVLAALTARARQPQPAVSPSPEARGTLVIHAVGDVSLDPSHIPAFQVRGYRWAWSGVGSLFLDDSLTIANLECPVTDVVAPAEKPFITRCAPAALPSARAAGVDVMSQANNHAFDQGPNGLLDSLARIRAAGLLPVGAGADQAAAIRAVTVEVDGWRVAVLGIDQVLEPPREVAGPSRPGTAGGHDFVLVLDAIRAASRTADVVLVAIHWGVEFSSRPTRLQIIQGHRMVQAGADAIFGAHAHRVQRVEVYRGRPIFYSLGNFVWPALSAADSRSAIAEMTLSPDGSIGARLLPATIVADGHPTLDRASEAPAGS
jgi:poly-gamma-glutamate capsule biosynthesis protein CapA/YwtB (metallophosphatase superfamily)